MPDSIAGIVDDRRTGPRPWLRHRERPPAGPRTPRRRPSRPRSGV